MKIIVDEKVYVQYVDINFLLHMFHDIPESIITKINMQDINILLQNKYDFMEFNDKESKIFFESLDWMIEYNTIKNFKEQDFKNLALKLSNDRHVLIEKFRNFSIEEKHKNANMVIECEQLEYQINSLHDIVLFKMGELKFNLPVVFEEKNTGKFKKMLKNFKK